MVDLILIDYWDFQQWAIALAMAFTALRAPCSRVAVIGPMASAGTVITDQCPERGTPHLDLPIPAIVPD